MPANHPAIHAEIVGGLKNERERMACARVARDYYEGNFEPYMADYGRILAIRDNSPNRRSIPYVRSIIDAKIRRFYMADPEADDYRESASDRLFGHALQQGPDHTEAGRRSSSRPWAACAMQVELNAPKSDGEAQSTLALARPAAELRLWAADEFAVWCSPDELLTPYAVAVLDRYDNQTRCRLWTPEVFAVYTSKNGTAPRRRAGTRIFEQVSEEPNFIGLVPFAFQWWTEPTKDFWVWSPGEELVCVSMTTRTPGCRRSPTIRCSPGRSRTDGTFARAGNCRTGIRRAIWSTFRRRSKRSAKAWMGHRSRPRWWT